MLTFHTVVIQLKKVGVFSLPKQLQNQDMSYKMKQLFGVLF